MRTAMQELIDELERVRSMTNMNFVIRIANDLLEKEKKQIGYTEEQAYEIWKAGQEYWKTSGKSITFEDLIENFKPKSILQPNL